MDFTISAKGRQPMPNKADQFQIAFKLLDLLNSSRISSALMNHVCSLIMEFSDWDLKRICTHWVIMQPHFCADEKDDYYQIVFGYPPDNMRHNIGGVGQFHYPNPKEALIQAIRTGQIIQVNDALNDPLVEYMRPHVRNKRILSIAVVPIAYRAHIISLVILDKVINEDHWGYFENTNNQAELENLKGFSRSDMAKIQKMKSYIENRGLDLAIKNFGLADYHSTTGGQMDEFSHIVLNKLIQAIALLKKSVPAIPEDQETQRNFAQIAISELKLLEHDVKVMMRLVHHTCPVNKQPVKIKLPELIPMLGDGFIHFEMPSEGDSVAVYIDPMVGDDIFKELRRYIETNRKSDERVMVSFNVENPFIRIDIKSSAFMAFKETLDLRIAFIKDIITGTLEGAFSIKDDHCLISLPLAET